MLLERLAPGHAVQGRRILSREIGDGGFVPKGECGAGGGDARAKLLRMALRVLGDGTSDELGLAAAELVSEPVVRPTPVVGSIRVSPTL